MRRLALSPILLALSWPGAGQAQAPAAPYPTKEVAAEFEALCGKKMKLAERRALAARRGWVESREAAPARTVVARDYQDKLAKHTGGLKAAGEDSFFRRTVAGEALELVVFRSRAGSDGISGCDIFDPGEGREDLVQGFETVIGGRPIVRGVNPGLSIILWGTQEGAIAIMTQLGMIPPGSEAVARLGFSGLRLQRDYAGKAEK